MSPILLPAPGARARTLRPWTEWTVAITGMNARADNPGPGLAVARALRADPAFRGRIIGLGYDVLDPGLHIRAITDAGYLLPYPSEGPAALRDRLDEVMGTQRLDAIIPALDSELVNFAAIQGWLTARGVRSLIPDTKMIEARAKDRLPELGAQAGVATPPCRRITDPGYFDTQETWPVVVKGCFYDAHIAHTKAEARSAFHKIARDWGYPILVQPFVAGTEVNLAGIGDGAGGLIGAVAMRKRALTDKGKAWAGITIREPALEDMAARLIAALNWRGPFEAEILKDPAGALHLIEINPRFPAWIYLSAAAGRNLPAALLRLLAGESDLALGPPVAGHCFIRYAEEVVLSLAELETITVTGASAAPRPPAPLAHAV